ncbi:MAG: hypothetical protein ACI9SY_000473 [Candidatus Paceibacteria bacterium]|jgi:hypothetical protein
MAIPKSFFAFTALLFLTASVAQASVVVRTGDQLEVSEGDIVDGELVAIGLPVVLSNNVTEDATLIGNRVTVNGQVGMDLLAVGFFVDVNSPIQDDVRIMGGEVTISSPVAGDVIIFGGAVDILSTASVAGDVIVYGGTVSIAGAVQGDVAGVMEELQINSSIGGGVDVVVTNFSLGDQAVVADGVEYTSYNLVAQSLNASVQGDIVRSDPLLLQDSGWMQMAVLTFLIGLFSTLVWYLCSRKSLMVVVRQTNTNLLRSAFIGFLAPTVLLIIIAVLFLSQLGMYVAVVGLFGLITLILLAGAAAPAIVGHLLVQVIQYPPIDGPLPIVLGVLVLTICMFVPVIGILLVVAAAVLTFGGLLESLFKANR